MRLVGGRDEATWDRGSEIEWEMEVRRKVCKALVWRSGPSFDALQHLRHDPRPILLRQAASMMTEDLTKVENVNIYKLCY